MSYIHNIIITSSVGNAYPSYYDENLKEHIITDLNFVLSTTDVTTTNFVKTYYSVKLPPPNPANLIPCKNVSERTAKDWLDEVVDIVALQNDNIQKLKNL